MTDLRRRTATALTALVFACAGDAALAAPAAEAFVHRSGSIAVSPSGAYIAFITGDGKGNSQLAVAPFANGEVGKPVVSNIGKRHVLDLAFKTDDRLLLTVLQENVRLTGVRFVNKEDQLVDRSIVISVPRAGGAPVALLAPMATTELVKSMMPNDPDHVVLEVIEGRFVEDMLYRVATLYTADVNTGETKELAEATSRGKGTSRSQRYVATRDWEVDQNGEAYIRYDVEPEKGVMNVMGRPAGGDWSVVARYAMIDEAPHFNVIGRASGSSVYGIDRSGGDLRSVWEYDMGTGKALRQVLADGRGEANSGLIDPYRGTLVGAGFVESGMPKFSLTSKPLAAAQAALDASTDYPINQITGFSRDYGVIVAQSEGPAQPPENILLDARNNQLIDLGPIYPLSAADMSPVSSFTYASSDGRTILAHLTVPKGAGKSTPIVVMPHGGPEASDTLEFDGWRQFLASRGYIVLQPQFRGSDGYGAAFEAAGHKTWSTLVQDDVRFGLAALAQKGIGDPARTCIFGWSYGGYMALAGATFSPDQYKCAIAGAGPSNLTAMMSWVAKTQGSDAQHYWLARMGEKEAQAAASPDRYAAQVKIPILLIHGEKDQVVPIEQSELMEAALKKAGRDVTFKRLPDEGHSPSQVAEADVLNTIDAFLAKNLGH